ncbi:MAG TPA: motility-associated protein [Bryobacteraceae bacterium]|nr:motility-associated protein [Bryobacteraceae bacterium]
MVVLASVVSGYLLERGSLLVLLQPSELLIVGGAVGIVLISGPRRNLRCSIENGTCCTRPPRVYSGDLSVGAGHA